MFGTLLSLVTLGAARQVHLDQVLLGAALAPVVVAVSFTGRRLHGLLDRGWLRPAVLLFAVMTGLSALVHALT
jgi:uncharacterized membrane protein YfcA